MNEVLKEPGPDAVPFDLGGYSPDLVAKKGGQGLIIEVKPQTDRRFEVRRFESGNKTSTMSPRR